MKTITMITVDIEEWFHILDSPLVPEIEKWEGLESRIERNLDTLLQVFSEHKVRATFFWLGWMAQRHKSLLLRCKAENHEIASHSYSHLLAYKTESKKFFEDISKAKLILEDAIGSEVVGFRAPGFGIKREADWAFDIIKKAGYRYDSSVFPMSRGHGGISDSPTGPHLIQTEYGPLPEIPMSVVSFLGKRYNLFGGGYLRLSPLWLTRLGIKMLNASSQPVVVYVHPREVDPRHPRLPLNPIRRFKSYVNLESTLTKLRWLCKNGFCCSMKEYVDQILPSQMQPAKSRMKERTGEFRIGRTQE